jgi:O-acetyl-ADP-ribose deacetylase (regulator of RNase III)
MLRSDKDNQRIEVLRGDITTLEVDIIVNAANRTLLGGGGVDGAIHKAAGPGLLDECIKLNGCDTGNAKITAAYNLRAKYIIHTVGPVWKDGINDEHRLLASCYQKSLLLAGEKRAKTIAFPGISTGIYGFPKDQAALIAVTETKRYIAKHAYPEKVIFVAFDNETLQLFQQLI